MPLADLMQRYPRVAEMAREADPNTNLYETPIRYSDPRSVYAGSPEIKGEMQALGGVWPKEPTKVYLKNDWIGDPKAAGTLAHEGTHSKLLLAGKNRTLDPNLKARVKKALADNPTFWEAYTGQKRMIPLENLSPEDRDYLLSDDEMAARIASMESRQPKGQMIEKGPYSKTLFGEHGEGINDYLNVAIPEGYMRNDRGFTPIKNQTRVTNKSLLESIKDYLMD